MRERREIIVRDGHAVRAGAAASIEVSAPGGTWAKLTLPGGALAFESETQRDIVLNALLGLS